MKTKLERKWTVSFCLAVITLGLYWPLHTHDFIFFDDPQFITENSEIKSGLNWHSLHYAFTSAVVVNWHPITTLSHILDCQFFGVNPGPQHLISAFIHALNAGLLFLLLTRLTGMLWRSAVVAALFAWHPLRVESVAWIAERKDVLSGFFFLLTVIAYARYVQHSSFRPPAVQGPRFKIQGSRFWYFAALAFFALGLMSKPMLVTLPFVLLLLDVWPLRRSQPSAIDDLPSAPSVPPELRITHPALAPSLLHLIFEKVPFLLLSVLFSALTLVFQKNVAAYNAGIPLTERAANALVSYFRYLGKFFWPAKLSIIYPYAPSYEAFFHQWPEWLVGAFALLLIIISVVCLLQLRHRPYLAVGWFWYLGMMLPVIGLIQVGEQSMADRYTYLPLLGPAIAIVWLVSDLWKSGPRGNYVLAPVCCGVFAAMLLVTSRQISLWQNTVTLFQHAVDVTSPNDAAEVSLGVGLETQGKTSLAEEHYRAALAINPRDQQALYNFGQLLKKRGDWQGAADEFAAVVAAYPENLAAHLNLAAMLGRLGRDADAIHEFQAVLQADPNSTEALNNLAWLLATSNRPELRDGAEAVRLAERACQLTDYREPAFIGTLAAAYAEAGRLTDAVKTAEKACQQAEAAGNQDLAETNRRLLEIYRAGKPWHEEPVP